MAATSRRSWFRTMSIPETVEVSVPSDRTSADALPPMQESSMSSDDLETIYNRQGSWVSIVMHLFCLVFINWGQNPEALSQMWMLPLTPEDIKLNVTQYIVSLTPGLFDWSSVVQHNAYQRSEQKVLTIPDQSRRKSSGWVQQHDPVREADCARLTNISLLITVAFKYFL